MVVSLRIDGVRFVAYSNDHPPRHVHGFTGDTEAIVDLRMDGQLRWQNETMVFAPQCEAV
jgi:hypothetical protein